MGKSGGWEDLGVEHEVDRICKFGGFEEYEKAGQVGKFRLHRLGFGLWAWRNCGVRVVPIDIWCLHFPRYQHGVAFVDPNIYYAGILVGKNAWKDALSFGDISACSLRIPNTIQYSVGTVGKRQRAGGWAVSWESLKGFSPPGNEGWSGGIASMSSVEIWRWVCDVACVLVSKGTESIWVWACARFTCVCLCQIHVRAPFVRGDWCVGGGGREKGYWEEWRDRYSMLVWCSIWCVKHGLVADGWN